MDKLWPHPIKAIIYDNDGLLMNTEWVYTVVHKECTGTDLTWDFKVHLMGKTGLEACRLTCEHFKLDETPESLLARRSQLEKKYWPTIPMMPGAEALVKTFKEKGLHQAIATGGDRANFEVKSSQHHDVTGIMEHIITGDDVAKGKPAPDLFLAALHGWSGYAPENALVFEDSPLGIKAANVAGIPAVFVPDENMDAVKALAEYDAHPVLTITSLEQFPFDRFDWQSA